MFAVRVTYSDRMQSVSGVARGHLAPPVRAAARCNWALLALPPQSHWGLLSADRSTQSERPW